MIRTYALDAAFATGLVASNTPSVEPEADRSLRYRLYW
jgi:hypothetical protein